MIIFDIKRDLDKLLRQELLVSMNFNKDAIALILNLNGKNL